MGNQFLISRIIGGAFVACILTLISIPFTAHAASKGMIERLCERQSALLGRLSRPLIDPTLCKETPPPPEPTVTLSAEPTTIEEGGLATLEWNATNATSCTATGGWSGAKTTSGDEDVAPLETTTYTLTCIGEGGTGSDSVTVIVINAPAAATLTLVKTVVNDDGGTADANDFQARIDGVDVAWGVAIEVATGTRTVSETTLEGYAAGSWGGDCAADGTVTLAEGEDKTCTITNDDIEAAPDAPTLTFSAHPTTVHENSLSDATTTLIWDSTNAAECTASGSVEWTGDKALDGSAVVTPTADVTYKLDCTGPGGSVHGEVAVDFVPEEEPEGKLLITEVLYDLATSTPAQGQETANEWVELYNGTNADIILSNYTIADASSTDALPEVVLPAGAFALVVASSTTAGFYDLPEGTIVVQLENTTIGNGLGNIADSVRLLDSNLVVVDAVSWGTNTDAFDPPVPLVETNVGHSIERTSVTLDTDTASDWEEGVPTPGQ